MTGEVGLGDEQWWEAITHGPAATIGTYRWAYQVVGVAWPGDAEVRRRHPIVEGPDTEPDAAPPTVVQLDWPQLPPNPQPQPTAAQRLAEALGWQQVPEFSDQEQRKYNEEFEAAQAQVRRFYGIENDIDNQPEPVDQPTGAINASRAAARSLSEFLCNVLLELTSGHRWGYGLGRTCPGR